MFREFFRGRYGVDSLTLAMLLAAAVFSNFKYLWVIGVVILAFAVYRTLSKDIGRRYKELQTFLRLADKTGRFLARASVSLNREIQSANRRLAAFISRLKQRKHYLFIKCPTCKSTLRLPKNKGKLRVTCPVCKAEFFRKT